MAIVHSNGHRTSYGSHMGRVEIHPSLLRLIHLCWGRGASFCCQWACMWACVRACIWACVGVVVWPWVGCHPYVLPHTCCHTRAATHMLPHTCCHTHAAAHMLPHTCCPTGGGSPPGREARRDGNSNSDCSSGCKSDSALEASGRSAGAHTRPRGARPEMAPRFVMWRGACWWRVSVWGEIRHSTCAASRLTLHALAHA